MRRITPASDPATSDGRRGVRTFTIVLAAALVLYNTLVGGRVDPALYVPVGVALTALVAIAARKIGLTGEEIGTDPGQVPAGLRWGLATALAAAAVLAVAVLVPAFHPILEDARAAGIGVGLLLYRALVRMPFGTALLEEVAFRGVLLGAWRRVAGTGAAVAGSSVVFGLWHVRPALDAVEANEFGAGLGPDLVGVALAVAATTAGGVFFCWLRLRSRSIVAPIVAHAAMNALALTAAFIVM